MPSLAAPDAPAPPVQAGRAAFSHFQYIYTTQVNDALGASIRSRECVPILASEASSLQ
jgi:hypothetical protein